LPSVNIGYMVRFKKIDTLFQQLAAGDLPPIILLLKDDVHAKDKFINLLTQRYVKPAAAAFDLRIVYGDEIDAHTFDFLRMPPSLSERKIMVIKRCHEIRKAEARLALFKYVEKPIPTSILVLSSEAKLDTSLLRDLANKLRPYTYYSFTPFKRGLREWVVEYCRSHNKQITGKAIELLTLTVGEDKQMLATEIDKIILLTSEKEVIDEQDVANATTIGYTSFHEFTKHLGIKNLTRAFIALSQMIEQGENLHQLWAFMRRKFMHLLLLKSISEYERREYLSNYTQYQQIERRKEIETWNVKELEKAITMMYEHETQIKRGILPIGIALKEILVKL